MNNECTIIGGADGMGAGDDGEGWMKWAGYRFFLGQRFEGAGYLV